MEDNIEKENRAVPEDHIPAQADLFTADNNIDSCSSSEPDLFRTGEQDNTPVRIPEETAEVPVHKINIPSAVSSTPKARKWNTLRGPEGATIGQMLIEARELSGLDLLQVSEMTRIRKDYLEAIEQDNLERLPVSRVFIQSYIRTMTEIYQLDNDSKTRVMERFREQEKVVVEDVPEKILEHIGKDGQISEDEAQRVRLFCIYGGIILFLLISLAVTSIVAISIRNSRREALEPKPGKTVLQNVKVFDSSKIESLLAPQVPDPVVLEIPQKK